MSASLIDSKIEKGTKTDVFIDRDNLHGKRIVVNDVQDVEPLLDHNKTMREHARRDANRGEFRVIADVPKVIYFQWKNVYGFDMLSPAKSNWGLGMSRDEHKRFLRALLNANPALKTVDESV